MLAAPNPNEVKMAAFPPFKNDFSFVASEHETLKLWDEKNVFERSVAQRKASDASSDYVFYDGPPFATGLPHYGHLVASTIKDIVPRYWAMRGRHITRRFVGTPTACPSKWK